MAVEKKLLLENVIPMLETVILIKKNGSDIKQSDFRYSEENDSNLRERCNSNLRAYLFVVIHVVNEYVSK